MFLGCQSNPTRMPMASIFTEGFRDNLQDQFRLLDILHPKLPERLATAMDRSVHASIQRGQIPIAPAFHNAAIETHESQVLELPPPPLQCAPAHRASREFHAEYGKKDRGKRAFPLWAIPIPGKEIEPLPCRDMPLLTGREFE